QLNHGDATMRYCEVKLLLRDLLLLCLLITQTEAASDQHAVRNRLDIAHEHKQFGSDFVNAVDFVSHEYHIPIIAEVTFSANRQVLFDKHEDSARQLLNLLISKIDDCAWEDRAGVIHIYQKQLLNAPGNFLNVKLKTFLLSGTMSDFKLALRTRLYNASQGFTGTGGVISDFPSQQLSGQTLPRKLLRDVTGRDILFTAAKLNPQFSSIIVFPRPKPEGKTDMDYASRNWFWLTLNSPDQAPLTVQ